MLRPFPRRASRNTSLVFLKKLLVVDLETTGLDPDEDSIVQIAACVLSRKALNEEAAFSTLVAPESPMDPSAQRVHGLTPGDLRGAPPLDWGIAQLEALADPGEVILCGHNVSFDTSFLKAAYKRVDRPYPYDYHTVDLWSVAFFIFSANGLKPKDYRLDTLAGLFGVKRNRHHDALQDVRVTAAILRHLYQTAVESGIKLSGQQSLFSQEEDP